MKIHHLEKFLAVIENKGFTKAGNKMEIKITQSGMSVQIKALEDELGVKLFDRLPSKKVVPTAEGKLLFELVSPLMQDITDLPKRFKETCGNPPLHIATHTSVMTYLLPETVKAFRKKYPDCELSIVNRSREEILSMLKNGEIDMGIAGPADLHGNFEYEPLGGFERILIAQKGHPISRKRAITPAEIAKYPLILSTRGTNTRRQIEKVFEEKGLKFSIAMEVTGREAVKTYVGMGLGISIMNDYYLTNDDRKKLFTKNVSPFFGTSERGIITRKGKYLSAPAKEFIEILSKRFAG